MPTDLRAAEADPRRDPRPESGPASGPDPLDGLSDARLDAWRAFLEAHARATAQLARELQDEERLPLAWYDVLVQLSEAPERRLRMQDLADRVLLSQSGLTRLVDRMQREGLVERLRCQSDGRGTYATLTPQGLAQLRDAYPTHLRGVRAWFADLLEDDEVAVLARALRRVADAAHLPAGSDTADRTGGC